jgi:hypothetical protein
MKKRALRPGVDKKYRGLIFTRMTRSEVIEWAAILNPGDQRNRIEIRVQKRIKGKESWVYQVRGSRISETGVQPYLSDALDAATRIALADCGEVPTQ